MSGPVVRVSAIDYTSLMDWAFCWISSLLKDFSLGSLPSNTSALNFIGILVCISSGLNIVTLVGTLQALSLIMILDNVKNKQLRQKVRGRVLKNTLHSLQNFKTSFHWCISNICSCNEVKAANFVCSLYIRENQPLVSISQYDFKLFFQGTVEPC